MSWPRITLSATKIATKRTADATIVRLLISNLQDHYHIDIFAFDLDTPFSIRLKSFLVYERY